MAPSPFRIPLTVPPETRVNIASGSKTRTAPFRVVARSSLPLSDSYPDLKACQFGRPFFSQPLVAAKRRKNAVTPQCRARKSKPDKPQRSERAVLTWCPNLPRRQSNVKLFFYSLLWLVYATGLRMNGYEGECFDRDCLSHCARIRSRRVGSGSGGRGAHVGFALRSCARLQRQAGEERSGGVASREQEGEADAR